jgi:hypothetical protein
MLIRFELDNFYEILLFKVLDMDKKVLKLASSNGVLFTDENGVKLLSKYCPDIVKDMDTLYVYVWGVKNFEQCKELNYFRAKSFAFNSVKECLEAKLKILVAFKNWSDSLIDFNKVDFDTNIYEF